MRLLMSTLNMEFELSTKSASDVQCGFLTKSLNFHFGCLFLVFFFFFPHLIFFLEKCLDGYHIIKTFAGSFNVKKSSSETFGTARGIDEEIEFVGSDFGP